jgi:pyridoxamine 5'-phosphate oxidase
MSLADMRMEYDVGGLLESDMAGDPITQFQRWFAAAQAAGVPEPNAMTVASVGVDGRPSARVVLLKGVDYGFVFFTNYTSRKGHELEGQPFAALVFYWHAQHRQVRVEGRVEQVDAAESDAYFASRPPGSQIGAWASAQSQVIAGREALEQRYAALQQEYAGQAVPRPPHWGGFRVVPDVVEFWQGRPSRLHDRLCFRREAANWKLERLSP